MSNAPREKTSPLWKKALPQVCVLLAIFCFASAFLGSVSARGFFNSPAAASLLLVMILLSAYLAVEGLWRKKFSMALCFAGVSLIIAGGLWGSGAVLVNTGGEKFPLVPRGRMILQLNRPTDKVYCLTRENILQLPFTLKLNRCGAELDHDPLILLSSADHVDGAIISSGEVLGVGDCELSVEKYIRWAKPVYAAEFPEGPLLSCVSPDGSQQSCTARAGESLTCPQSGSVVYIEQVWQFAEDIEDNCLQLNILAPNAQEPTEYLLEAGEYLDLPGDEAEKLMFNFAETVDIAPADPNDSQSWPFAAVINIKGRSGHSKRLVYCWNHGQMPFNLHGKDNFFPANIMISAGEDNVISNMYASIDAVNGESVKTYDMGTTKPLHLGGYRLYISNLALNDTVMIVNVACDRGRQIAYTGMFLLIISAFTKLCSGNRRLE